MKNILKRRDFLFGSMLTMGGFVLGGRALAATESTAKGSAFKGLANVDKKLFEEINRVTGTGEKTRTEKKHAPVIEVPAKIVASETFAVSVTIGEINHPMGPKHYIQNIDLLVGNEPAGHIELRPDVAVAKATFYIRLDKPVTLVARTYCNLHGLWESRFDVTPVAGA
jgi:superoxide reductase